MRRNRPPSDLTPPSPAAPPTTVASPPVPSSISMEEREGFLHGRDLGALRDLERRVMAGDPDLVSLRCLLFDLCSAGAAGSGSLSLYSRSRRCASRNLASSSAPATPSPPSVTLSPPSTPASSIPRRWSPSRRPDLVRSLLRDPRSSKWNPHPVRWDPRPHTYVCNSISSPS